MKSKPDRTRKARAAKARTLARENGGAQISTLIGPDAAMRLAEIRRAESMTLRQAIEAAILNYPINGSGVTSIESV